MFFEKSHLSNCNFDNNNINYPLHNLNVKKCGNPYNEIRIGENDDNSSSRFRDLGIVYGLVLNKYHTNDRYDDEDRNINGDTNNDEYYDTKPVPDDLFMKLFSNMYDGKRTKMIIRTELKEPTIKKNKTKKHRR